LVTLSEVLRLALPPGTEILAGESGLERQITWARTFGNRPVALGSIEPGELVLVPTSGGPLGADPKLLTRLIRDLTDAGVAAFVVGEPCDADATEAARAAEIPLLQLPPGASLADAERAIVGLILDRDGQIRRRLEQMYERMVSCLMDDQGAAQLVAVVAEATAKQVVVLDEYLHSQAVAPDADLPEQLLGVCAELIQIRPRSPSARATTVPLKDDPENRSLLLAPLMLKGLPAGYLVLLGPRDSFTDFDSELAHRATSVLAMEIAKQRAITEVQLRVQGDLVEDLLAGTFPSEEAAHLRARALGHDLTMPHIVSCFALDSAAESTGARSRALWWVDPARRDILRTYPTALVRDADAVLTVLLPIRRGDPAERAVERVEELRQTVAESVAATTLSAGVGRPCGGPSEFARGHREAQQALMGAQLLFGGDQTASFDQLGVDRLLLELRTSSALREFVSDMLSNLETHDRRQRSELTRTVETFLACNGNHVRTAQELHLHRNSLLYRLERAQSVLGQDLDQTEVRLALQLALRGRRLLGRIDPTLKVDAATADEPRGAGTTRRRNVV
jgi:purine catabolism regulator